MVPCHIWGPEGERTLWLVQSRTAAGGTRSRGSEFLALSVLSSSSRHVGRDQSVRVLAVGTHESSGEPLRRTPNGAAALGDTTVRGKPCVCLCVQFNKF